MTTDPSDIEVHALAMAALEQVTSEAKYQEALIPSAVVAARRAGASWTQIGLVLGITRQSAWARYSEMEELRDTPA